ncbi:Rhodanese-like protein [Lophiostoma macrostomum CBS 122681]|uniref:M-phase inducer phosphatase n=1 Tax=Lophiostoma macrostomum CBS 122681 TaxID=1314788 RepID=A0A6A6TNM3_9PLEO|nr:Rhodanese-like protein [Lophiostoma macrostomum CBS 122681]
MHPPPLPHLGWKRDFPTSRPLFAGRTFGPQSFNFRDLSMKKPATDYFTLQPMRGSSPTASLAADMSSNLHVDQSPQLPTPRRSLFTSNLFQPLDNRAEGTTTPPVRWEGVTTPPIPSSSPSFVPDSMDISPLPHKNPFSFVTERPLPSPTPDTTPTSEVDMLSPCELPPSPQLPLPDIEVPRPVSAAERRKSILVRPGLNRNKNYSTNTVSFKSRESNPLPAFKFGAGVDAFSATSSPSLDECFTASPPQDRKLFSNPLVCASKPKPLCLNSSISRANGSPLSANIRKPAGPPARRPSKFRRSLSMYEHPGDVMNQKEDQDNYTPSGLQSVMDIDDAPTLKLPHFTPPNEPDSIPRITDSTLIEVLNGEYNHMYNKTVVVDCRFEYEYQGGHIDGAVNFCDKEQLAEELFKSNAPNTLLIFHCEYSAHRAPLMAKFVRHEDRKINSFQYPQLTYPEVYILDGGYSAFYSSHRTRCYPQNYLRMDAKEHENACERGMNKLRQRTKLNRAQTFAFGQHSCQMEDSPTAIGRSKSGGILTLGGGDTFTLGRIGASRRMASY